jgi:hypothetical protein
LPIAQQTEFRHNSARGQYPTRPFSADRRGSLMVNRIVTKASCHGAAEVHHRTRTVRHRRLGRADKRHRRHGIAVVSLVSGGIENLSVGYRHHDVDYEITGEFTNSWPRSSAQRFHRGRAIGDWTGGVAADAGGAWASC